MGGRSTRIPRPRPRRVRPRGHRDQRHHKDSSRRSGRRDAVAVSPVRQPERAEGTAGSATRRDRRRRCNDVLPVLVSGLGTTVDVVRCQEIFDYSTPVAAPPPTKAGGSYLSSRRQRIRSNQRRGGSGAPTQCSSSRELRLPGPRGTRPQHTPRCDRCSCFCATRPRRKPRCDRYSCSCASTRCAP